VRSIDYARLAGTILLCAVGLWFAVTGRAKFGLGGDPDSPSKRNAVVHVDAVGLDAVAIGAVFVALGIVNLSLGIRGPRRIPVFWAGAGLMAATFIYGAVQVALAIAR
jgi:hypothetical protein